MVSVQPSRPGESSKAEAPVPYRLPPESRIRLPLGQHARSWSPKLYSSANAHLWPLGLSLKIVPAPCAPPASVEPYTFPDASTTKPPLGSSPRGSPLLKFSSSSSAQLPPARGDNWKTVPYAYLPPPLVVP